MEEWKIQGSDEWKKFRKSRVTATDSAIIMGLNPWVTPYKLWCRKLGLIPEEPENEAMRRGKEMEAQALEMFNEEMLHEHNPDCILHADNTWMMASIDGINVYAETLVEIKCGKNSYQKALELEIPDYYYAQMQFQLACTGFKMAYYFCFDGVSHILHHVFRDQDFIDKMIPKCREFYECMLNLTPPQLTDKDYVEVEDERLLPKLLDLAALKREIKRLEILEKVLEDEVKRVAIDLQCNLKGAGIRVSNRVRRGTIDYQAIPELEGVDIEVYRKKPTQYWEIRLGD